MAALDRIQISGFKSIRECDLTLPALTLLIGGNGAGKSNFIGVFGLLGQMVTGGLQAYVRSQGGPEGLLHFGQKRTNRLALRLEFGSNAYRVRLAPTQDDSLFYEEEVCEFRAPGYIRAYEETMAVGLESRLRDTAIAKPGKVASYVHGSIASWKVYHFHDTSAAAGIKQLQPIDDNLSLRSDASNLAAFLLRLQIQSPNQYQQILGAIRSVTPFFDDFQLRESARSPGKIRLEWREKGSDTYFNGHSLSDGTLRFMCLATLLLQPSLPSTILLDEPELGLHPYALGVLSALLQSASTRAQVIVSTQSVTLVNHFEPKDVLVTEREGGQTVFRRASEQPVQQWVDEYGLGDLWEKNVLGGRPAA